MIGPRIQSLQIDKHPQLIKFKDQLDVQQTVHIRRTRNTKHGE